MLARDASLRLDVESWAGRTLYTKKKCEPGKCSSVESHNDNKAPQSPPAADVCRHT